MPLIEQTIVKDGDEIVRTDVRRLYSLEELKKLDEEGSEEIESGAFEKALDKIREIEFEDVDFWSDQPLEDARELFKACGITVPKKTVKHRVTNEPVLIDDTIYDEWDIYRRTFVLNNRAVVDEKQFLRALKWYLAGKDIRTLPELQWGSDDRPIAATGTQVRNFDLRSKDARLIRDEGLAIYRVSGNWGGSTREFDHSTDVSEQTQHDANDLLSDLCHEALRLLDEQSDYIANEEHLLEEAEINEWRFDRTGRFA